MPTSVRWEVAISPKISVKPIYSAGGQSRPPLRGTSASKSHRRGRRLCPPSGKFRIRRGFQKNRCTLLGRCGHIDPYTRCTDSVRNSELFQITREKSRKTEAVFLVGSRRSGGKSKSLRARFLFATFSFGEAKEKVVPQPLISESVIVLI